MLPSRVIILSFLLLSVHCLDVVILVEVRSTLDEVVLNTRTDRSGMIEKITESLSSADCKCLRICQLEGDCFECGESRVGTQDKHDFEVRFISATATTDLSVVEEATKKNIETLFGKGTVNQVSITSASPPLGILTSVSVSSTITDIRSKLVDIKSLVDNTHRLPSVCSSICDSQECYDCQAASDPPSLTTTTTYVVSMTGTTLHEQSDLGWIQQQLLSSVEGVFNHQSASIGVELLTTTNFVLVHLTLDTQPDTLFDKVSSIEEMTNTCLGTDRSKCSAICEIPTGNCVACDAVANGTSRGFYTAILATQTMYKEAQYPKIQLRVNRSLQPHFGSNVLSSTVIKIAETRDQLSLRITVDGTLKEIYQKKQEVIDLVDSRLTGHSHSRCTSICGSANGQEVTCLDCTSESYSEVEGTYTYNVVGETIHGIEHIKNTIAEDMNLPLQTLFGNDAVGATVVHGIPPETPAPAPSRVPVLVRYSLSLNFDTLLHSIGSITDVTQSYLKGSGAAACVSICDQIGDSIESIGDCFTCSGGNLQMRKRYVLSTNRWVLTIRGTTIQDRQVSADDLNAIVGPLILSLGGTLHNTTATLDFQSSPIPTPSPSDDDISGAFLAAIVVGGVVGVAFIILLVYCFACTATEPQAINDQELGKAA